MTENTRTPLLINEKQAAAMLGISPRTMWSLRNDGEIKSLKVGARVLYSIETLTEWIKSREAYSGDANSPAPCEHDGASKSLPSGEQPLTASSGSLGS